MNRSNPSAKKRYPGVVRIYLRDQGVGQIQLGERQFRFGITDLVGDQHPLEGDRVSFMPQLQAGQLRARQVSIETRAHATGDERLAREIRPESAATVRAAKVRAPVEEQNARLREHVRCGSCRRLVLPKMVRVKAGLFAPGSGRWVESCPRCRGALDGKTSSLKMLWGATAAMIGGALVVTRSFFF